MSKAGEPSQSENLNLIGRAEIDDLEAILAVTNTDGTETLHAVSGRLDSVFSWDFATGARPQLDALYEKGKASQWNAATDIPWDIEVDQQKVILGNVLSFGGYMPGVTDLADTPFKADFVICTADAAI